MKPELTLTKEEIENFSINVVDNYEGCAEATLFLKRIYGEQKDDLRKRKKDFVSLSKMGKASWIINFLLNTITKPYRAKFLAGLVSENLYLLENDALKLRIVSIMSRYQSYAEQPSESLYRELADDFQYLHEKREEVKRQISAIGAQAIQVSQKRFETLMTQSQFLKGIMTALEDINSPMTRTTVKFCESLGEANQWKFMRESDVDYNKSTLENCAITLIDYVGYFVETE